MDYMDQKFRLYPFSDFQGVNHARTTSWHKDGEPWSLADWGNAAAGEMGEACNVIKKLRRIETGTGGNTKGETVESLKEDLANELADTVTYLYLIASFSDINMQDAIIAKFNKVSEKQNLPQMLQSK